MDALLYLLDHLVPYSGPFSFPFCIGGGNWSVVHLLLSSVFEVRFVHKMFKILRRHLFINE